MNNIGKESKISNRYKPIVELKTPLDRHLKEHSSLGQKSPILDNQYSVYRYSTNKDSQEDR